MKPSQPTLYALAEDGYSLNFFYVQCDACRGLSFPANVPGCMHCGDALHSAKKVSLPGSGELLEYVTLQVPLLPGMQVPSVVGDVRIQPGIVEEVVIEVSDEAALRPGMPLKAVAKINEADGVYACRFVPADQGAAQ